MQEVTDTELPVVILRGNDICFLGIMRSCANAGIPYKTVTFTWPTAKPWWSEHSKYFTRDFEIENPFSHPVDALQSLIGVGKELLAEYGKPLLAIPSSDTNLMFLLDNEEVLSPYFTMMGDINFASYRNDAAHKYECSKLLEKSPVAITPATFRCSHPEDINNILEKVDYPVVFKPATKDYGQSFYLKYNGLKAVECTNHKELKQGLQDCIENNFDVIVQEKILFDKVEDEIPFYAYIDKNQNIRMAATGIKELIQPYPFGTANVLRLTWHPELLEVANHVVKALKWRGIIMIEFIRDKKDGQWKVIEINVRPWLFIGFYRLFGLNYVSMLYNDWQNKLPSFNGETITPSADTLGLSPLHFELAGITQNLDPETKSEMLADKENSIIKWMKGFQGSCTMPYYDINDLEPSNKYLENFISLEDLDSSSAIPQLHDYIHSPDSHTRST